MRKKGFQVLLLVLVLSLAAGGTAGAAVMVPLRPALETVGVAVHWDGESATAFLPDGRNLRVVPGGGEAYADGAAIPLEATATMLGGVLFVPGTLLSDFPEPPAAGGTGPVLTLVQAGELSWLVGTAGDGWDYRTALLGPAPGDEHGASGRPGPERAWLLPKGNEVLVNALLARLGGELRTVTGGAYSLAPEAGAVLKAALAGNAAEVTLPVQRLIGSCVVQFNPAGSNYNNMLNAVRAADYLDGTVVPPGGIFSYNGTVGPRTADRGFLAGYAISGGRHVPARGGGVCRTSTVLYGAVLDAGLDVVERYPHSLPVGYVPAGRDATVSYGGADLKFRNNRGHAVRIEAGGTVHHLYVHLWEISG